MADSLSLQEMRFNLESNGHQVEVADSGGLRVRPKPESSIVVALEPDVTLRPAYRQRFFLCQPGAEAILARNGYPVPHLRHWDELLGRMEPGPGRDLLAGPAAWTLARVAFHHSTLIWAVGSQSWEQTHCGTRYALIESQLGRRINFSPWRTHLTEGPSPKAYYLQLHNEQFAYVLAAYFLLSSYNFFEFYLTDPGCTEVYEIHHHDQVVASVATPKAEQELLRTLTMNPDLYTEASGYQCTWDDEDTEGGEE